MCSLARHLLNNLAVSRNVLYRVVKEKSAGSPFFFDRRFKSSDNIVSIKLIGSQSSPSIIFTYFIFKIIKDAPKFTSSHPLNLLHQQIVSQTRYNTIASPVVDSA
jgi:hypothetical protein